MLRSLTDKVTIFLHPEYIAAVKHRGLVRKRMVNKEVVALESDNSSHSGVIDALIKLLQNLDWKSCRTQIVLSGHFTKLRIVKWNEALTKQEQETLVQHQLEEIYGSDDGSYQVFIAEGGFKKNNLAFAVNTNFYNSLQNLEKDQLIKLDSIVPYFVLMTNYWVKTITRDALVVIVDNAYMYFAKIIDHSWEVIKASPLNSAKEQDIELSLSRELMQYEDSAGEADIYLHAQSPSDLNIDTLKNKHRHIKVLTRSNNKEQSQLLFSNYLS